MNNCSTVTKKPIYGKNRNMTHASQEIKPYNVQQIPNWAERVLAGILANIPHLRVIHEPNPISTPQGVTQPDFQVVNGRRPNASKRYIEATNGNPKQSPHKKRQMKKMKSAGLPYNQFGRDEIARMDEARKRKKQV